MATVLTDTDCLIDYLKGKAPARGAIWRARRDAELAVSTVTVHELFFGAADDDARQELRDFLAGCMVLSLNQEAAELAAGRAAMLARAGTPLDTADLVIAGVALEHRLPIVTRNIRHFGRIEGLALVEPG